MAKSSNQERLFLRFINGECTSEELLYIANHYSKEEQDDIIEELINTRWSQKDDQVNPEVYQRILSGIHQRIHTTSTKSINKIDYLYFSKVAATVIIFISTITFFFFNFLNIQNDEVATAAVRIVTKSTEFGQKLRITLPDRSIVVLNYGTTISYPQVFSDSLREVKLDGEAYFEIQKDSLRPFITRGNDVLVSVLGTTFNFNTRNSEIALAEGSVKLSANGLEAFLAPGQMASYSKETEVFTTSQFNPVNQLGWQRGVIYIEGYSIEKLVATLENWYGVEIRITGIDLDKEFSGELSNKNLESVLKGICFTLNCKYEINQDKIKLYGKE